MTLLSVYLERDTRVHSLEIENNESNISALESTRRRTKAPAEGTGPLGDRHPGVCERSKCCETQRYLNQG